MTKEELEKKVEELEKENQTQAKKNEALEADIKKISDDAKKQAESDKAKIESLEADNKETLSFNENLSNDLKAADDRALSFEEKAGLYDSLSEEFENYKAQHGEAVKSAEETTVEKREAAQAFRSKSEQILAESKAYFKKVEEIVKA